MADFLGGHCQCLAVFVCSLDMVSSREPCAVFDPWVHWEKGQVGIESLSADATVSVELGELDDQDRRKDVSGIKASGKEMFCPKW